MAKIESFFAGKNFSRIPKTSSWPSNFADSGREFPSSEFSFPRAGTLCDVLAAFPQVNKQINMNFTLYGPQIPWIGQARYTVLQESPV